MNYSYENFVLQDCDCEWLKCLKKKTNQSKQNLFTVFSFCKRVTPGGQGSSPHQAHTSPLRAGGMPGLQLGESPVAGAHSSTHRLWAAQVANNALFQGRQVVRCDTE